MSKKPNYIYTSTGKVFPCSPDTETLPKIPVGVYEIVTPSDEGAPVHLIDAAYQTFKRPAKIYGGAEDRANFIVESWSYYNTSTGVLLNGDPGGGKTVVMALIANRALADGIPVINIGPDVIMSRAVEYLDDSIGKAVVLFDEFEKFAEEDDMSIMHSFLDGVISRNFLSVICVNDEEKFPNSLLERPSRIRYRFDYTGISVDEIEEVGNDMGIHGDQLDELIRETRFVERLSYDKLISLIREMKRSGKSVTEVMDVMSLAGRPWFLSKSKENPKVAYKVFFDGKPKDYSKDLDCYGDGAVEQLLTEPGRMSYHVSVKGDAREETGISTFQFDIRKSSIVSMDDTHIRFKGIVDPIDEDKPHAKNVELEIDLTTYHP